MDADKFLARQRDLLAGLGHGAGAPVALRSFDSVNSWEQTQRTLERYAGTGASEEVDKSITPSMLAEEREAEEEISRQINAAMAKSTDGVHVGSDGHQEFANGGTSSTGGGGGAMALHGGVPFDSLTQEQMQMRLEIERRTAEVRQGLPAVKQFLRFLIFPSLARALVLCPRCATVNGVGKRGSCEDGDQCRWRC